jgi:hypothetical protein
MPATDRNGLRVLVLEDALRSCRAEVSRLRGALEEIGEHCERHNFLWADGGFVHRLAEDALNPLPERGTDPDDGIKF